MKKDGLHAIVDGRATGVYESRKRLIDRVSYSDRAKEIVISHTTFGKAVKIERHGVSWLVLPNGILFDELEQAIRLAISVIMKPTT